MPPITSTAPDRRERLALAWIIAVAIVCRTVALVQPIRYDEAVTWALFTSRNWWTILSTYPNPNNHVLFSLLAKATSALAPTEPWALRLPAFVAGVAIVPLTWAVGRRLAGRTTALLGAALAAGSTSLILYSTNARGHTIVGAVALVLILLADRMRAGGRRPQWLAFAALGAIGLYTVPVTVYPLGAVSLWIALDALRRARGDWHSALPVLARLAATTVTVVVLAALLYAPIIRSSGLAALTSNKLALPLGWTHFARVLPRFTFELATTWTSPLPWWSAPIVFALALWGVRRERPADDASLALATVAWCVGMLVLTHRTPFVRFWLSILPLFLLAVGRGLARWGAIWARRVPSLARIDAAWSAAVLATAVGVVALATRAAIVSDDTGSFPPARAVTALIGSRLRPGDRVLAVIPANAPL
ncbi:MAG: hypothetical protein JWN53_331, partial [Gemmatimonadetes bacterium]|nr:hypothetical protein [Gemmatimonadota bacterium]